ncbi:MAG TPA: response regulator [Stellaceae bacterium]|nr:response regulator [Stellaceae bacterium]
MSVAAGLEDKKILIVDDDASMRVLLRRMLSRMGIADPIEAGSGADALQLLAAAPVDLVMCDWNMPAMSGMELFQRARLLRPDLRFLMLTGRADADSHAAARKAGVAAFMVKPISAPDLKVQLTHLLGAGA